MEEDTLVTCAAVWHLRLRQVWVHDILRGREQHGEYHRLVRELRLDGERLQRYFRLNISV
ncbi:hypothetical protein ABVT39_016660 [Epinephelus coioides]